MAVAVLLSCAACRVMGLDRIHATRPSYNSVLQQTGSEQPMTNPVRPRYGDPLYFLDVSSVTTSLEFSGNMAGRVSFPGGTASGGVNYNEQSTIIYTPPQGEQFVRQILSPIDLDTLVLLASPGMPMDRLLRISLMR